MVTDWAAPDAMLPVTVTVYCAEVGDEPEPPEGSLPALDAIPHPTGTSRANAVSTLSAIQRRRRRPRNPRGAKRARHIPACRQSGPIAPVCCADEKVTVVDAVLIPVSETGEGFGQLTFALAGATEQVSVTMPFGPLISTVNDALCPLVITADAEPLTHMLKAVLVPVPVRVTI